MATKMLQVVGVSLLSIVMIGGSVFAQDSGTIENTGPGSDNEIEISEECRVLIENNTNIKFENNNPQTSESGGAEVDNNTEGGDAISGDATNESNVEINVGVSNETREQVEVCLAAAGIDNGGGNGGEKPTEEKPNGPPAQGGPLPENGGGPVAVGGPLPEAGSLPETASGNSATTIATVSLLGLSGLAVTARIGASLLAHRD